MTKLKSWATDLKREFSKERIKIARTNLKQCSASLAIREMPIKATLRFLSCTSQNCQDQENNWQ